MQSNAVHFGFARRAEGLRAGGETGIAVQIIATRHITARPQATRRDFDFKMIGNVMLAAVAFHQQHSDTQFINAQISERTGREAAVQINPQMIGRFEWQRMRTDLANQWKAFFHTYAQNDELRTQRPGLAVKPLPVNFNNALVRGN